jgi:hypothetical protein
MDDAGEEAQGWLILLLFDSLPGYLNIGQANSPVPSKVDHVVFSSINAWTEWLENCREIDGSA